MMARAFLGFVFFLFAFVISVLTVYICFRVVMRVTKYNDISLIKKNNTAASLVLTGSFVAMAIMVRNALYPIEAVIQDFWFVSHKSFVEYLLICVRALGYLGLTIVLSLASISSALIVFQKLTKEIEEEQEIMKNNIAVGLLLAGVLIAFALMVEAGIGDFVNTLIPVNDMLQ